jgi:hypothetical protein
MFISFIYQRRRTLMAEVTGRPVDIEIVPRAHAILSASSAERWLVCTPSARIEEQIVDEDSSFAKDGTAAHAFAEARLRYLLKQITNPEYLAAYEATKKLYSDVTDLWELSDWEAIDAYVQYVLDEAVRLEADVYIEARVSYTKYAQDGFGTSDALLVSRKHRLIKSIDLKFGKGIPVSAIDNPQAKLYALGGLIKHDPNYEFDTVEWAIVQPRLDYIGEDSDTVADLVKWAEEVVAPAAKKAWMGQGSLVPTAKGCRFCKVAGSCRARIAENVLIAQRDFVEINEATPTDIRLDDYLMEPEEIARILPHIDGYIKWANQFKAHALSLARDKGETIDGFKLVRGRSVRGWKPDADITASLRALGIADDVIFSPPPPEPTPRSVAQLEKAMGKKPFGVTVAPTLVVKPLGTPALVPNDHPSPAMNAAAEAAADFGEVE